VSSVPPPPPPPPPPSAPPPVGWNPATPGAQRRRIRWGIGDAIAAFVVGLVVSLVAAAFVLDPDHPNRPTTLIVLIAAQNFAIIGWLALTARRKGLGSLRSDFGLQLRRPVADWLADAKWLFAGVGLQLAALLPIGLLETIYGHTAQQDVVKTADRASGWQVPLLALCIVLLAPLTEELLFRGTLLRSLQRRVTPTAAVLVSAVAFGLVHALGDPSVGTVIALPAIVLLGVVSGYQAATTGNLSRSILLHVGFNALSVVFLFTN
jgi:membrane protease YdiL (CAAX protease family)